MNRELTARAYVLWNAITPQLQQRLLDNVWRPHCSRVTTMTEFSGSVKKGDLVLTGKCATCGGNVARVIEQA